MAIKKTVSPAQGGQRLDKYLQRVLPAASPAFLYRMLRKKNIVRNGKRASGEERVASGDEITFFFSDETFAGFSVSVSEKLPLYESAASELSYLSEHIVYEDEDILLLDKPAGVLSQQAEREGVSANEWFVGLLLNRGFLKPDDLSSFTPGIADRLDRNTSGILLFAKTLPASQTLAALLREGSIRKRYRMVLAGALREETEVKNFLIKDEGRNLVRVAKSGEEKAGKEARSLFLPISTRIVDGMTFTLCDALLFTGRSHQLRVHAQSIGCPLVGDAKYGDAKVNRLVKARFGVNRQLLHCLEIRFPGEQEGEPDFSFLGRRFRTEFPAFMPEAFGDGEKEG